MRLPILELRRPPRGWFALLALLVCAVAAAPPASAAQLHRGDDEPRWPDAPAVDIDWLPRDQTEALFVRLEATEEDWNTTRDRRDARLTARVDDVAMVVRLEQFRGITATRVTVCAINGFSHAGLRYFQRYRIAVDGREIEDIEGRHVILPRGALIRRTSVGPDASRLSGWTYVREELPVPSWAPEQAARDTERRTSFPMTDFDGKPVNLGPYNFFWPYHSLGDSHGGWGVGPFHGGPDDWLVCAEGRRNREAEMLLAFQRPIWMFDDDFQPLVLQIPYWMGRTLQHQPEGFRPRLEGWCPYERELLRYAFADHTHLSRGTSGAAAVAPWDAFAVDCMAMVLADFKTANSMTRVIGEDGEGNPIPHPGAKNVHRLQFPLWKTIEIADGPTSSGGDRGLAHKMRFLRWCRPYFPAEDLRPFEDGLRELARKLADQYGITHGNAEPGYIGQAGGRLTKPLVAPYCQVFHQQFVTYEFRRFGGLDDLAERSARFLTRRPPSFFEVRPGAPNDTCYDRNNTADADQKVKFYAYEAYASLTHDFLPGFDDPAEFVRLMGTRGINGSSQDLDNVPRRFWERGM